MSSSGVTNYSCTELEIAEEILSKLGVKQNGQSSDPDDIAVVRRNLNMIYKQWVAQADFAPGLKMWTRRRAYLFLTADQVQYSIGPSGDECAAESFVTTTLSSGAVLGTSSLNVTSGTDLVAAMRIGILLSTGAFQWTTISSVIGTAIGLDTPLTAAAASGTTVFAYTAKPVKPFEITSASLRDLDDQDTPMDPHMSLDEYELLGNKGIEGTPSMLYFEAKKDEGRVYLNCSPDEVTSVIRLVYTSYVEDTSAQTQDVDFPGEWFGALVGQGAINCAPNFGRPVTPDLKLFRDESLRMARNSHPETSVAFYQSEPDEY